MEIRRRPPNPSIKVANLEYAIPHPDSKPKNILEEIVWEKHLEVEIARKKVSLEDLKKKIKDLPKTKNFIDALRNSNSKPALISEIKKASPSRGIIREDFDAKMIGKMYQEGGANCISVLTDKKFFKGATVLDAGCGNGTYIDALRDEVRSVVADRGPLHDHISQP